MKYLLKLFLCILSLCSFAQTTYKFDQLLEYSLDSQGDGNWKKQLYLVNSKDNSYFARIQRSDSSKFHIQLIDYKRAFEGYTYLSKEEFDLSTYHQETCTKVASFTQFAPRIKKNYYYVSITDTIEEGKTYQRFVLKSRDPKREKRKKLVRAHYKMSQGNSINLPLLHYYPHYYSWTSSSEKPLGTVQEVFYKSVETGVERSILRLQSVTEVQKTIMVSQECQEAINNRTVIIKTRY